LTEGIIAKNGNSSTVVFFEKSEARSVDLASVRGVITRVIISRLRQLAKLCRRNHF